jgi:hypothetical protein
MGVPLAEVRRRFDEMAVEPAEDAERGGCDSNDYWSPDGE